MKKTAGFSRPSPRWDISDCGLGRYAKTGLAIINLAEEPEYSEKLIYCWSGQGTPMHAHKIKKEDIICRSGEMGVELWAGDPRTTVRKTPFQAKKNGTYIEVLSGEKVLRQSRRTHHHRTGPVARLPGPRPTSASSAKFPRPTTT